MTDTRVTLEELTALEAQCDQAQALIDEARTAFPDDVAFQRTLNLKQQMLDIQRETIKGQKKVIDWLNQI